jgi:hypothetical protein
MRCGQLILSNISKALAPFSPFPHGDAKVGWNNTQSLADRNIFNL